MKRRAAWVQKVATACWLGWDGKVERFKTKRRICQARYMLLVYGVLALIIILCKAF